MLRHARTTGVDQGLKAFPKAVSISSLGEAARGLSVLEVRRALFLLEHSDVDASERIAR